MAVSRSPVDAACSSCTKKVRAEQNHNRFQKPNQYQARQFFKKKPTSGLFSHESPAAGEPPPDAPTPCASQCSHRRQHGCGHSALAAASDARCAPGSNDAMQINETRFGFCFAVDSPEAMRHAQTERCRRWQRATWCRVTCTGRNRWRSRHRYSCRT